MNQYIVGEADTESPRHVPETYQGALVRRGSAYQKSPHPEAAPALIPSLWEPEDVHTGFSMRYQETYISTMSGSNMQIQNANETDVGLIHQSKSELSKFYSFAFE